VTVVLQVFYKVHIVGFLGIMVFTAIHYSSFAVFVIPGARGSTWPVAGRVCRQPPKATVTPSAMPQQLEMGTHHADVDMPPVLGGQFLRAKCPTKRPLQGRGSIAAAAATAGPDVCQAASRLLQPRLSIPGVQACCRGWWTLRSATRKQPT
jgi:hypothetical protein